MIYAFFGALWILLSDRLLSYLVPSLQLAERLQTYKGWFFVAVTSVLLWLLAKRFLSRVRAAEEALHRLNRKLQAISNCNQMLLRATDEQSLLEEICRIVCEEAGYSMAWVGYAEHDEAKSVRPVAWTGTEEGYLANLGITWADTERGSGPTGTAIRSGKTCCIQDFATDPRLAAWRQSVLQRGYRSGSALPLKDEHDKAFGSLTIYSAQPNAFTPEEIRLLEELAGDLAFGIVTLRSGAARKRAEEALRESEANLNRAQEIAHIGSWHLDIAHNQLTWSDEVYRMFDKPRGTALSYESFLGAIHPEDRERVDGAWAAALQGAHYDIEHRILVGDELKWVRERAEVEFDPQGKAVQGIGTVQDITERKHAEEERRESAERFRAIADYTYDWENWSGVDGKLLWVNPAVERITGYSVDECMVMPDFPMPIVAEADREAVARQTIEAVQGSSRNDFEFRVRHKDGRLAWVAASWQPIYDVRGARLGYRSSIRDIGERKKGEDALRRSEAYLEEAQRLSHSGSWGFDLASNTYIYASDECLRIFELDAQQELPAREALSRLIRQEDWHRVNESFEKSVREKVDTSSELRIVLPSGTVKHIQAIRHPVLNDAGDVATLVGTVVDLTERKRAEEALRESEARFRTFVDHAADAFFMLDFEQATILDVNRTACESLGYTREELIGKTPLAFDMNLDASTLNLIAERTAAGETVLFARHLHRRKDGSVFPVELQTSLFWNGGRRFLLKVARDITDRVRAEEERERLRKLEADLAHIDRVSMMGELAASIAHEVNQPLSGIVSNGGACLRWLAGDPPNVKEVREAVRDIVRDGKRAGEVIARIRALTKRTTASKERLDLNETIREVLAIVGDEARRRSVVMQTRFADDLSPVSGDRVQLQQVLLNLVMNSIEAMSSVGTRARELGITTWNVDPDQVQVTVEDSGTGLDPHTMDKIFESFYTTKPGGMGIGLSISRSILVTHGGRLWATARDGPGTMFHFTLPKYHEEGLHAGVAGVT